LVFQRLFDGVGQLSQKMSVKANDVIKTLMNLGVMANINQALDQDTAVLVVEEFGHTPKLLDADAVEKSLEDELVYEGEAKTRAPVVTVMGHVDHGKTSLLDYIRKSKIVSGEAGGITQHIGAYRVTTEQGEICFIDTPGHEAFTAMRARGANCTALVSLVDAADDGVMPQTEEAIQHAKGAGAAMVVAINKIDVEGADIERVKNELAQKEVIPDDWGGDIQFVPVSAVTGQGVDDLLEAILLQAEILELTAVEEGPGQGVVIESELDKGKGPVATLLIQNGTLNQGDTIVAGQYFGRVRAINNEDGRQIKSAGPSTPVSILGLNGTPNAGDSFIVTKDERRAREVAEFREDKANSERLSSPAASLDNLLDSFGKDETQYLNIVVKADVRGSLEAIVSALNDLGNDEVKVNVVYSGVGGITESDVNYAITAGAVIFGFNVRADNAAKKLIEQEGLDLRYYKVIYDLVDDVKAALSGMLSPEVREDIVGIAEVRDVFQSKKFGQVAGCMVVEGGVTRSKRIRVLRDNVVIFEGELESLRRFKDEVEEVRAGTECGIGVRNYNDVKVGDQIEVFDTREVAREL
ncbi:MAG: translation initiation factor IF-2, partial [Pseudomonadales bacterium]|nr:translation initiation factor IF-2 [Pseudomonadales bacterium]